MRVLRGVGGRVLACGCLVGIYETYKGEVVATLDARGPSCSEPDHRPNTRLPVTPHPPFDISPDSPLPHR